MKTEERKIRLRHAERMATPGRGTWKRLRFWGAMVLVIVVGFGLLCWHSYRKSLGPPPTPPGKSLLLI